MFYTFLMLKNSSGNIVSNNMTIYKPPSLPVTLNQYDEIIIEHPEIPNDKIRHIIAQKSLEEKGLTKLISSFDLIDSSSIEKEDDSFIFNSSVGISPVSCNADGQTNYWFQDFRNASSPYSFLEGGPSYFRYYSGAFQILVNSPTACTYENAKCLIHTALVSDVANNNTKYIEFTVPQDLPVGKYKLFLNAAGYWHVNNTNGQSLVIMSINDGPIYTRVPNLNPTGFVWQLFLDEYFDLSPGDKIKFFHPEVNGNLTFALRSFCFTQLGDVPPEVPLTPTGNALPPSGIVGTTAHKISYQADFRDATTIPTLIETQNTRNGWGFLPTLTANITSDEIPVNYYKARSLGHYYYSYPASDEVIALINLPSDLPEIEYDLYIYMNAYNSSGKKWIGLIKNTDSRLEYPDPSDGINWSSVGWRKCGTHSLKGSDVLKFVRPNNNGANVGGVNLRCIQLVEKNKPAPTREPVGNEGNIRFFEEGFSYPLGKKFIKLPTFDTAKKKISKINNLIITYTENQYNYIGAIVSFDAGISWKYFTNEWVTINGNTIRECFNQHYNRLSDLSLGFTNYICNKDKIIIAFDFIITNKFSTPKILDISLNIDNNSCFTNTNTDDIQVLFYDNTSVVFRKVSPNSGLYMLGVAI